MLLHDAVPSHIRAGVSSGAGTFSWMLFLPFSLGFGALARAHGVYPAGWIFVGTAAVLAALLVRSTRTAAASTAEIDALVADIVDDSFAEDPRPDMMSPPLELACQQVVRLVSDYLGGDLPADWRARVAEHLGPCDGCTTYLEQIRQTVALLEQIDAAGTYQ